MQYDGYGHRQGEKTLNESEKFYQENLYPLQDGVLNLVKNCKTHFYLTGGTALSRIYYNHRYSDDLDFFVNADIKFNDFTLLIYNSLLNHGYEWSENDSFVGVNYKRLLVRNKNHPNVDLKFVLPRTKSLDKFLKKLKEAVDVNGQVYINKTTWANDLGIDRKTLSDYINQFTDSNHFIEISYDDERYDKSKDKRLTCLEIIYVPLSYKEELIDHLRESIKNFYYNRKKP